MKSLDGLSSTGMPFLNAFSESTNSSMSPLISSYFAPILIGDNQSADRQVREN